MNKEEKELLLDHNYDGIQEFDYALPSWWLATFWGGIIFGIGYIIYFIFMNGPSLKYEYYSDAVKIKEIRNNYMTALMNFDEEKFKTFRDDENMVLYGKSVFDSNCKACHNSNAAGDIGPNLTDSFWLYTEGSNMEFYQFIINGNPTAGMPAWGQFLEKDDLYAVTAYINSMRGYKHIHPVAKEPQGSEYPINESK